MGSKHTLSGFPAFSGMVGDEPACAAPRLPSPREPDSPGGGEPGEGAGVLLPDVDNLTLGFGTLLGDGPSSWLGAIDLDRGGSHPPVPTRPFADLFADKGK